MVRFRSLILLMTVMFVSMGVLYAEGIVVKDGSRVKFHSIAAIDGKIIGERDYEDRVGSGKFENFIGKKVGDVIVVKGQPSNPLSDDLFGKEHSLTYKILAIDPIPSKNDAASKVVEEGLTIKAGRKVRTRYLLTLGEKVLTESDETIESYKGTGYLLGMRVGDVKTLEDFKTNDAAMAALLAAKPECSGKDCRLKVVVLAIDDVWEKGTLSDNSSVTYHELWFVDGKLKNDGVYGFPAGIKDNRGLRETMTGMKIGETKDVPFMPGKNGEDMARVTILSIDGVPEIKPQEQVVAGNNVSVSSGESKVGRFFKNFATALAQQSRQQEAQQVQQPWQLQAQEQAQRDQESARQLELLTLRYQQQELQRQQLQLQKQQLQQQQIGQPIPKMFAPSGLPPVPQNAFENLQKSQEAIKAEYFRKADEQERRLREDMQRREPIYSQCTPNGAGGMNCTSQR